MTAQASADGVPKALTAEPQAFSWTGYYFGAHLGSGLGRTDFSNPYGPSIFGDTVRTPEALIGLQGGYNWQAPGSRWLLGAEAELSALDARGTNTCFAVSGEFTSSTCKASPDFTGSLTGRVGYATGLSGRTLLYLKGGVAFLHNDVSATTNNGSVANPDDATGASFTRWGGVVGAGLEQAITPAWSLKFEYDYRTFADADLATPDSISTTPGLVVSAVPGRTASLDQDNHLVKVGINYRLGSDPYATFADSRPGAPFGLPPGWSFQPALRYWYSVGRYQKDWPASGPGPSVPTRLISRLTWDDLTANSGEVYGRVDTPWRIFAKGFFGTGRINGGHLNDEDWGDLGGGDVFGYSNTLSQLVGSGLDYVTADLGVDALRGDDYRAGLFLGYSRVHEQYADDTCAQLAAPTMLCVPSTFGEAGITETDTWNSLRLGATADVWLTRDLQLTADAAYLPHVWFKGRDEHWQRALLVNEKGSGHGTQLELLLSYHLSEDFSVGVGGRYWAMWTTSGSDIYNGRPTDRDDSFKYERAGVFLQGAYTFDACCGGATAIK